jgi:hypothetical protein
MLAFHALTNLGAGFLASYGLFVRFLLDRVDFALRGG